MAKVIKGEKKLAIIVSQKEFDLIAALVGMTMGGTNNDYDLLLWCSIRAYVLRNNTDRDIAKVNSERDSIVVLNRDQEEY